ncbi:MAG: aspartate-semialdehyde dehydrogenase [Holosporales bacterium]|jgi:aspartate-semialdehyde dehydrogenase|nr:aspartate-semialdehyde dehydrogenase [Holosporales bacterium]
MLTNVKILVVGATGKVGREMLSVLLEYGVNPDSITAAASIRSAESVVSVRDKCFEVLDASGLDFSEYQLALFSAGSEISRVLVPEAIKRGCWVIDNSSHFRMNDDVPLIIPEVNFVDLGMYRNHKLIANPNCSTIQMVMALKPLHDIFILDEIVVSTYQSVSGAGQKGVEELKLQSDNILRDRKSIPKYFKKQIAFNVIPQIDVFTDSSYTKEELKMMNETKKILNLNDAKITATCVRVPVFIGHAVSIFAKFKKRVDLATATTALNNFTGITVADQENYATPIDSAGLDDVFVSRIRKHPSDQNALSFWCVSDNLRKGAALNAVQIAINLKKSDFFNN